MDQELTGAGAVDGGFGADNQTTPATGSTTERWPNQTQDNGARSGQTPQVQPAEQPITAAQFREYQANFDRRYEQQRQEATRAQQQAQQLQNQLAQMQAQWQQQQLAALPEEQRPIFENQQLRQQLQVLQQRVQFDEMKSSALRLMQQEAKDLGIAVSLDELSQQPNADDAWRFVLRKGASTWQNPQQTQQRQEKREANAVDLGGGAAVTPATEHQARYDRALKTSDAKGMLDAMYDAMAAGVELNT